MLQPVFLAYEILWYCLFAVTLRHSVINKGIKESTSFFVPAVIWGLLLEYATQEVFLRYHYGEGFLVYIGNVPLNISLAWASLMYFSYWIVTQKLHFKNSIKIAVVSSVPLLLLDILTIETTAKIFGFWVWTPESLWFGSPLGNVYGWFWVITLYLFFYNFMKRRVRDWKKTLLINLLAVGVEAVILISLLSIWNMAFGNL
jgi:uncharacterized membrane protein